MLQGSRRFEPLMIGLGFNGLSLSVVAGFHWFFQRRERIEISLRLHVWQVESMSLVHRVDLRGVFQHDECRLLLGNFG